MAPSSGFFEQIPVEIVKRIAKEFPEENAISSNGENAEMPDEVRSSREIWRELAEKVQHEQDPERMLELIQQLIAIFDQQQLGTHLRRKRDTGTYSGSGED